VNINQRVEFQHEVRARGQFRSGFPTVSFEITFPENNKNEKDSKEVRMMKQQIRRNMITKVREDKTKYKRNRDKKMSFVF
jgi:hypothetical protein